MQSVLETLVAVRSFNMKRLYEEVQPLCGADAVFAKQMATIEGCLGATETKKLLQALIRNTFLIATVVTKGGAAKTRVRWDSHLADDQRGCSFDECREIFSSLLQTLSDGWLDDDGRVEAVKLYNKYNIVSFESHVDYLEYPSRNDPGTRLHRLGNVVLHHDEVVLRTLRLRQLLLSDRRSTLYKFFQKLLKSKIKLKVHMTDRVQTGLHQTNREYRWEVHPHSVHFCLHRYALAIEYKLMCEVFSFADCPADLKNRMEEREIIPVGLPVYRCPITLDPIPFELFKQELLNPRHGKSDFQIGHINPLKAETPAGEPSGNTAANMSWVTVDGNRIQGHLRLAEVRTLLQRITRNYQEVGLA